MQMAWCLEICTDDAGPVQLNLNKWIVFLFQSSVQTNMQNNVLVSSYFWFFIAETVTLNTEHETIFTPGTRLETKTAMIGLGTNVQQKEFTGIFPKFWRLLHMLDQRLCPHSFATCRKSKVLEKEWEDFIVWIVWETVTGAKACHSWMQCLAPLLSLCSLLACLTGLDTIQSSLLGSIRD